MPSNHRTWTFKNKVFESAGFTTQAVGIHLIVLCEGNDTALWIMNDGSVVAKPHDGKGPEHYRASPMWEEV